MTKHMRGVHVAQVPMRAMLAMAVSIVSVLLSLLPAHTANALPLGVERLLSPVLAPLSPSASSQPAQNSGNSSNVNTAPAAPQSQGAANQPSSISPSSANLNVAPVVLEGVEPLAPVTPIDTSDLKQPLLPLAYLASAKRDSRPTVTVASATTATPLIQASEEGWRLFGVAWYWWLVATGLTLFVFRYLSRNRPVVGDI